ncbi:MAG: hypothetical protein ABI162_00770 [Luteolibacter sp.]
MRRLNLRCSAGLSDWVESDTTGAIRGIAPTSALVLGNVILQTGHSEASAC